MFHSRAARYPAEFTAVYDDGERYLTAPVVNLSDSGLFIQTADPAPAGVKVRITPLLPPARGLPELEAEVVRIQDGASASGRRLPGGMGLRFVGLSDADAEVLRRFCAGETQGQAGEAPAPAGEPTSPDEDLPMLAQDEAELVDPPTSSEEPTEAAADEPPPASAEEPTEAALTEPMAARSEPAELEESAPESAEPEDELYTDPTEAEQTHSTRGPPETQAVDDLYTDTTLVDAGSDPLDVIPAGAALGGRTGVTVAVGVLQLLALVGVVAYGAWRLDGLDRAAAGQQARQLAAGQQLGFLAERQRDLKTKAEEQGAALAELREVVVEEPTFEHRLGISPAGAPGRFAVRSEVLVDNRAPAAAEVAFALRQVWIGDTTPLAAAPGRALAFNGPGEEGPIEWKLVYKDALAQPRALDLDAYEIDEQETGIVKRASKIPAGLGEVEAGGRGAHQVRFLVDMPAGGLITSTSVLGVVTAKGEKLTLRDQETTGTRGAP